jgi:hypothetical protein
MQFAPTKQPTLPAAAAKDDELTGKALFTLLLLPFEVTLFGVSAAKELEEPPEPPT